MRLNVRLNLKQSQRHYLAGLLEGEGSFMKGPPSDPTQPRIVIQMTDKDVVQGVRKILNSGVIYCECKNLIKWKKAYRLMIKGKVAVKLMMSLYPLMGKRRQEQIKKALQSVNRTIRP